MINVNIIKVILSSMYVQYQMFMIKVLQINSWLFEWPLSTDHDARMDGIFNYLQTSDYDIVFMQENWLFKDYQRLRSLYPYSTLYGTPGSKFCPELRWKYLKIQNQNFIARHDQIFLKPQNIPLNCHGIVTFSKHPIIISEFVEFYENIDEIRERALVRGFSAASIMVWYSKWTVHCRRSVQCLGWKDGWWIDEDCKCVCN